MTRVKFVGLQLIFMTIFICEITTDWVDPHSMDSSVKAKLKSFNQKVSDLKEEYYSSIKNCDSDLYLKRLVRLILNNAYFDKDEDYFIGHVNINLRKKDYEFLLNFSQSDDETKEDIFSEVSSVFEVALQKSSSDKYREMILTVEEQLYFLIFNHTTGVLVLLFTLLYVIYKMLSANLTWQSILKNLFFLLFIIDFVVTYLQIRKEEEIDNMVNIKKLGTVPPECDPQKLSWWPYIKTQFASTFFEHPCKTYYEMVASADTIHLVAPTKILARQFKAVLVEPVGDLGEAFGKFGRHMFANLPWGLNVIMFPVMLIAILLIVFTILLFTTKPRFKISLFHLFTLEIGEPFRPVPRLEGLSEHPKHRAIQRIGRREVGYNTQHRALIEEASSDNHSSKKEQCDENNAKDIQELAGVKKDEDAQIQMTVNDQADVKCSSSIDNLGSNQAELPK